MTRGTGNGFLCISIVLLLGKVFGQYYIPERTCGIIYSEGNFTGDIFQFSNHDQSVNLVQDFRVSEFGWNETGSLKVEPTCKMEICNETYFDGSCQTLEQDTTILNESNVNSIRCSCARECKCSDIFMKKNTCARAYLKEGCNACNALYTDLSGSKPIFPEEFVDKVKALRLRKGCTLTIFEEEDYAGNEDIIDSEIIENYEGVIGSYECDCKDDEYVPRMNPPRPESYPPLINVPNTLDEVIAMLKKEYSNHPGLLAAYKSLKRKRSSKNAYILLIGSTGAGKSSAINLLFDNPNVTKVGGEKSTTTDIHEFRIPIVVDELGIANSELRVIDTPGLGDTRGLEQDAKFLATLDDFLAGHEELKDRIPNVVLIFHKFNDNRFDGTGSNFVKMIRGLDSFRERITDENYSNVIFVMSHFCSETKEVKRRPDTKLKKFKSVIENYSLFPKPTLISVAENKAKEQELPMYNGYFKLPNNEYYPRNLYEKLELVTNSGNDMVGLSVFRTAFRDSENFNVSSSSFELVGDSSSKVPRYFALLTNAVFNVNNTDVSKMLKDAHDDMDVSLKKQYPDALPYLQKSLNIRQINTKEDIPKTTTAILELLMALKRNDATTYLLEKALNIKAPTFQQNTIAGHGYNIFKDIPLPSSPFVLGDLQHSDTGFMIPLVLTCNLQRKEEEYSIVFETKQEYVNSRLHSLGVEGVIPETSFTGTPKPGLNIRELSFKNDSCTVSASREIRIFEFVLNDRLHLTKDFERVVKSLPVFNESDHENVERWKYFFSEYGTHVVKSVYGGGTIEVQIFSNKPFDSELGQAFLDIIKFAEDMSFEMSTPNGNNTTSNRGVLRDGTSHSLLFHGGDQQYHTTDLTKLSIERAGQLLANWEKSLKFNPTILKTEMRLLPMSQVVRKLGQNYSSEIDRVTTLLFNSTLRYVPPKKVSEPGATRENTPLMLEFMRMTNESNRQIQQLMLDMKKIEMENANRTHQLQLERLKWEREHAQLQERYRNEAALARNQAEADRRNWEKQLETSRIQKENDRKRLEDEHRRARDQAEKASQARLDELIKQLRSTTPAPRPSRSSCLKEGTKILMADWKEKAVDTLEIGDLVMDIHLKPTQVLGVSYEFLLDQNFFGYNNHTYFFTDSHLFVGPGESGELKFYAQSPSVLYSQNPLMEYLNVNKIIGHDTKLFQLTPNRSVPSPTVSETRVTLFQDPNSYAEDTKIYFLQVGSPTQTYFANGFVCRNEIPPVEYWPNTMSMLFRLMNNSAFDQMSEVPYTLEIIDFIDNLSNQVTERVQETLTDLLHSRSDANASVQKQSYSLMTLDEVDMTECIGKIFGNPTLAALGVGLYGNAGSVIAKYLDGYHNENVLTVDDEIAKAQHILFKVISRQLQMSVEELIKFNSSN